MLMVLRCAIWGVVAVVSLIIAVSGIILFVPFPGVQYVFCRAWCATMLFSGRWLAGIQYVVEGSEHLPEDPSVIMIKHSSLFEAYAQVVLFPRNTWVVKKELLDVPVFGWGLKAIKAIAIDRKSGGTAVKQVIEQGVARLSEGIWVTVFPEGTRVPPGTTRRYGASGAALAHAANCEIVPVAHNAADIWPTTGIPRRPGVIRVVIGPPVDASQQAPRETNELVQGWIESKMQEISSGYSDPG